jgi:hypothetical protein
VNIEKITQINMVDNCIVVAQPLITNDCIIAIKLPEAIPAPCMVENKPPEIGPSVEIPINPKMDGKKIKIQLTVGINQNLYLYWTNLLMINICK